MKTVMCFILVTEEEFLTLAENLRPWTERAMKIEVAPWIRDYVVAMQDLYCELILEKLAYKPFGKERTRIDSYKDLIVDSAPVPNKILAKGDPGMGKTTWAKKIAWDWGKGDFSKISLVLLLFLKSVHPNDSLEKVLLQQIPELVGLGITQDKIESILEHFGRRCLLICDGLDELSVGRNNDVLKVIQHQKYLNCNILVTSRPHSIVEIQGHCDTVVSVEGFTRSEARKFASHIVLDQKKVEQILDFNPAGGKQEVALCKCPILLSFMCILVREKAVDLANKTIPTGEIYTRMVQCLYKKFTIRREIQFDEVEFTKVVGLVGKLAWASLLLGDPLFQRSRVDREVGKDAFDYGFLIGHEDLIGDVKADIVITFPHRSIQEFFGAFFFVVQLIEGKKINALLSSGDKEPILMMNPLFLHFCFWFLSDKCNEQYFILGNKETACKMLHSYIYNRIHCKQINMREIVGTYPAIDIASALNTRDDINMWHFSRIFEMFDQITILTLSYSDPIDKILISICRNVTLVVIDDHVSQHYFPELTQSDPTFFNFVLSKNAGVVNRLFQCTTQLKRQPVIYLFLTDEGRIALSDIVNESMHKLHVISTSSVTNEIVAASDLISCPLLTHLSIIGNVSLHQSVMLAISRAVRGRRLPNLKYLTFSRAKVTHQLEYLFEEGTTFPNVTHLNLSNCELDKDDIEALSYSLHNSLIPQLTSLALKFNKKGDQTLFTENCVILTSLSITGLTSSDFDDMVKAISPGVSRNLRKLHLSACPNTYCKLEKIEPSVFPRIEDLRLPSCGDYWWFTSSNVERFSNLVTEWRLHTLDISHNKQVSRRFSVLMSHHFTSLKALILHDCALNEQNLITLIRANREGRLPSLEHLDLSGNADLTGSIGKLSSKWNNLKRLRIDHKSLFAQPSDVPAIESLERLDIVTSTREDNMNAPRCLIDAVKSGHFPALQTVCLLTNDDTASTDEYSLRNLRNLGLVVHIWHYRFEKLITDTGLHDTRFENHFYRLATR